MCGIFGFGTADIHKTGRGVFENTLLRLFLLSEGRGREASGLCIQQDQNLHVIKQAVSASKLVKKKEYQNFLKESLHKSGTISPGMAAFGHTRLATNGDKRNVANNQPVIVENLVGIHNGIICNEEHLWKMHDRFQKESLLDSEILFKILHKKIMNESIKKALSDLFQAIEGTANIAFFPQDLHALVLATNNGSLYYCADAANGHFVFASEKGFLEKMMEKPFFQKLFSSSPEIKQIKPFEAVVISLKTFEWNHFDIRTNENLSLPVPKVEKWNCIKYFPVSKDIIFEKPRHPKFGHSAAHLQKIEEWEKKIRSMRRCAHCILPASYPYIQFDEQGICNFCCNYRKKTSHGIEALHRWADQNRSRNGNPDCLVALSGGRDSCFVLHYLKKELGMNPIAYSFDWGLVTDLARRNQSRLCGKLGVELIIISADIEKKREYIRKNIQAWLKKPDIGLIPLFIAGDKMFLGNANRLGKKMGIKNLVFGMNELENTDFKEGYCGIARHKTKEKFYDLTAAQKLKMLLYYGRAFLKNPSFFNSSLKDTIEGFISYYLIPHDYVLFFSYYPWKEEEIEEMLKSYNWETAGDTCSTWRIGDGTASFYNYIYYTVGGFTECDSFRSNQIREGLLTREKALDIVRDENKIRYESMEWYCDSIGININKTIGVIDNMPRRY